MSAIAADVLPSRKSWEWLVPLVLGLIMAMMLMLLRAPSGTTVEEGGGDEDATGCSPATIASGATAGTINTAITNASDGDTICFAASGTWSATTISLNPRNAITLMCESKQTCTMSGSSRVFDASHSTTKTGLVRISGFHFTGAASAGSPIISIGYVAGSPGYDKLRIDNNWFDGSEFSIAVGHGSTDRAVLGVFDNNLFEGAAHDYVMILFGGGDGDWGGSYQGTDDNLFIEDNTFDYDAENLGASGMDMWHGGRMVVRHNTITNARVAVHGYCHGGPVNLEVYSNTITGGTDSDDGFRLIHHQGSGEFIVFDNVLSPQNPSNTNMSLLFYPASTPNPEQSSCNGQADPGPFTGADYPIAKQPGRTGNNDLRPVYLWNNRIASGGAIVPLSLDSAGGSSDLANLVMEDRDWFEAVSASAQSNATTPFNGTTGMGFGTLANRPTTCSVGVTTGLLPGDSGDGGVGYFATDQGAQGTLYRCGTANTWSSHYQPYTYPHPVRLE